MTNKTSTTLPSNAPPPGSTIATEVSQGDDMNKAQKLMSYIMKHGYAEQEVSKKLHDMSDEEFDEAIASETMKVEHQKVVEVKTKTLKKNNNSRKKK